MSSRFEVGSGLRRRRITTAMSEGKRDDGRSFSQMRPLRIRTGIFDKAEGSAEVFLGNTRVIVGVKIDKGEPFPDTPNQAVLTVNSEFTPIASPAFEPGPPDETSIELARVVDRGIRSCDAVDLAKLCMVPGKTVYVIFVDIFVLNQDGNLIDASAIGTLAALKNTKIPEYSIEKNEVRFLDSKKPLELTDQPVAVSLGKIGNNLVLDMSLEEEDVAETRFTVTTNKNGDICALQKSGSEGLTFEEIQKAISMATEAGNEIRKIVMAA